MAKIFRILLPFALSALLVLPTGAVPVAENQELETYRGISVGGQLCAATPDGSGVTFTLTTPPSKGSVELSEDGSFVYTPEEGRRGRDYFGYRATDSDGNISQEAVVVIRLMRRSPTFRYEDTEGLPCDYAAHELAVRGLLKGQTLGGHTLFEPERTMSRGEFLTLSMLAARRSPLSAVSNSGYTDDASIATWLRPYAATALLDGLCAPGSCRAEEPVTASEAAGILNAVFAVTDVSMPGGGSTAADNLRACGLWDVPREESILSRGEAAVLLIRAMDLLKR